MAFWGAKPESVRPPALPWESGRHLPPARTSLVSPAFDDVSYDDVLGEVLERARYTLNDGFD